ncbi:MAG TPA: alcohol dehydrogenase [Thermoprotei archaeon]|nr:alcohol dehydrogenase [Thermoprotei archaeon]
MKAAIISGKNVIKVKDIDIPKPGIGEVIVKVGFCGICGTDIHIFDGEFPVKFPVIPGHEFSGEVVEIGRGVEGINIGDRVAVNPNIYCKKCFYCKNGMIHFCKNWKAIGIHRPGAYSEYVAVPEENIHLIPSKLSLEEAAFAEPVACCLHGMDKLNIRYGDTVVIFGLGPIGLIHLQLAVNSGASKIIGVDLIETRIKMAEKLGADLVLNASKENVMKIILEETGGRGVDKIIEATGNPKVFKQAVDLLDYGGKILVFGVSPVGKTIDIEPFKIYRKELNIVGSFTNPFTTQRAIKILASGKIDVKTLITNIIGLNEVKEYFMKIKNREKGIIKVLINPRS